jgi:uncharacterized protein with HEPN domain
MAERDIGAILLDILHAIEGIETVTHGQSLETFRENWLLRLGVQRALEIISEASRRIPDELLVLTPDIPWRQIRGVGNILRHDYHNIADEIVWSVVTDNLSPLKLAILRLQDAVRSS